jgi:1,4-dihydroxy-2-naphthoyl-CoA hydrolase
MTRSPQEVAAKANDRIRGCFPGLVGMRFLEISPHRVLAELTVREEVKQPWGILHGGAIATLLDTAAGAGAVANLQRGQQSVTVEIKVNFIGAVRAGMVTVEAVPLHRGRSTMIWESRVRDAEGRIVAAGLSTHMTLPAEPRPA